MAGKTYVTKSFSTYTNIPAPNHGYDQGPKNPNKKSAAGFTGFAGSPSKAELLKEYVHAPSMSKSPKYVAQAASYEPEYGVDYENSSPPKYHGQEIARKQSSWPVKTSDFSSKEKYRHSSPVDGYPSEKARLTHSRSGLEGTRHVRTGNISSSSKSWQCTGPTNNMEDSVYYSPRADPRRRGVLDDLSTRAQPVEPLRRYARPAFVANSHEGTRRYRHEP